MRILELVEIQPFLLGLGWCGTGRHVRVKGNKKVACHLLFGLVAHPATQLFKIL